MQFVGPNTIQHNTKIFEVVNRFQFLTVGHDADPLPIYIDSVIDVFNAMVPCWKSSNNFNDSAKSSKESAGKAASSA
eukprot:7691873-Karenia_brevis.AAC.1